MQQISKQPAFEFNRPEDSWTFWQQSSAKRENSKQLGKLQHQLNGVRAAAKALGDSTNPELKTLKKRVLSAAARAKISKATKARWAKFRAAKAKGKR